jgi:hypothetical protein
LLAITPPGRPLGVTILNTSALVLGGLLFALWAVAACHAGTGQIETGVPGQWDIRSIALSGSVDHVSWMRV